MDPRKAHPIDFFNDWFADPIVIADNSAARVVDAMNQHPFAQDETAQDYVMPARRYREKPGRFRIFGECQDTFYCFIYARDERKKDPPVYFESCLDLLTEYGYKKSEIIEGDHVPCGRFTDLLWQILGQHFCIRLESSGLFTESVTGVGFAPSINAPNIKLGNSFINPLGREFPAGFTCFVAEDVVCIPDFGATFLNAESRDAFIHEYSPNVSSEWE